MLSNPFLLQILFKASLETAKSHQSSEATAGRSAAEVCAWEASEAQPQLSPTPCPKTWPAAPVLLASPVGAHRSSASLCCPHWGGHVLPAGTHSPPGTETGPDELFRLLPLMGFRVQGAATLPRARGDLTALGLRPSGKRAWLGKGWCEEDGECCTLPSSCTKFRSIFLPFFVKNTSNKKQRLLRSVISENYVLLIVVFSLSH